MSAYTPRSKNLALVLLAMTQFVVVIDASILNVALPSIGRPLHSSRTSAATPAPSAANTRATRKAGVGAAFTSDALVASRGV